MVCLSAGFSLARRRFARGAMAAGLTLLAFSAEAGDILRGGTATSSSARRSGPSAANAGSDAAARAQGNARDRLARTTQSLDAVKAMQAAARAAVTGRGVTSGAKGKLPRVTDGLSANGLKLAAGVPKNLRHPKAGENSGLWAGAELPRETSRGGETDVTIVQTAQQAVLNWEKFNVGKKTTLTFDQSAGGSDRGKWVAFNKVNDPSGRPSQILGSIKADGQVYVINQNGILFGAQSQVNTHTLVASALPINDTLVGRGLLNNPDTQFLFSAIASDSLDMDVTPQALSEIVDARERVQLAYTNRNGDAAKLTAGVDYTLSVDASRRATVTLTDAGVARLKSTDPALGAKPNTTLVANYVGLNGDVTVQAGARLTSPTSASKVGGRVMLAGANVTNAGEISTPDGQTILAAGLQLGVVAHPGDDPSLRGLDVFVGDVANPFSKNGAIHAGTAINDGLIEVPRGNATITGRSVQQNGFIDSTTSVSLNGRIDLAANYGAVNNPAYDPALGNKEQFVYRSTGVVTLGPDSVTRILPEWSSSETAAATELPLNSQVNITGLAAHLEVNALVWAPGADVSVKAGAWNFVPSTDASVPPTSTFVFATGQIYAEGGAAIDVAGTTAVAVPLDQNILQVELRGAELANSPLQRDGALRGTTITIDARQTGTFAGRSWVGTPLGDASGFLGLLQRDVGQLTAAGGTVDLHAGASVVLQRDASIDVSGGWLDNAGGLVKTTKLVQGSRLIDIADATPDQLYDGVYDPRSTEVHSKWGITRTFRHPFDLNGAHYEAGYVQGANGGTVTITAPSMALDGRLTGTTIKGPRQVRETATTSTAPAASTLALTFKSQDPAPRFGDEFSDTSLTPPKIVFRSDVAQRAVAAFALDAEGIPLALPGIDAEGLADPLALPAGRAAKVVLSPTLLTDDGFGGLTVENGAGDITVPMGVDLVAPAKGSITLDGRNVTILGDVRAPGGMLSFTANNISPYLAAQLKAEAGKDNRDPNFAVPPALARNGNFVLGAGASLDVAGLVLDERSGAADATLQPIVLAGGSVDITGYRVSLAPESSVDASGGVQVTAQSEIRYGDAGAIAIKGGADPNLASALPRWKRHGERTEFLLGGWLHLGGRLTAASGATGGSLALQAPFIQVGGFSTELHALTLAPNFFDEGGFTRFALTGLGGALGIGADAKFLPGIVIAADTVLSPRVQNLQAVPLTPGEGLTLRSVVAPRGERDAVSLSFDSPGVDDIFSAMLIRGDLVMDAGASIETDPLAAVALSGDTVAVLGSISAPAGSITIKGGTNSAKLFRYAAPQDERPTPTVYIGSQSRLSTAGTTVLTPDPHGRRVGSVLAGGSIAVAGNIVAARGAVLDVSGAAGQLDLDPAELDATASLAISPMSGLTQPLASLAFVSARVESDAGDITLAGGQELFTDATLLGRAGGPSARGGTLTVSSGRFVRSDSTVPVTPMTTTLLVTQSGDTIATPSGALFFGAGGVPAIGQPVLNSFGGVAVGLGHFVADDFLDGGFDSLALEGTVRFRGPVAIEAPGSIKVGTGGVIYADDTVDIAAPYVALGTPFKAPILASQDPTPFGTAQVPINFAPVHGPGRLTVRASLIDIGNLSLRGIGRADFLADGGDIRGAGTLNIAGHLLFRAGQIYTPTAQKFTVVAYDYPMAKAGAAPGVGSVRIQASGVRPLPLSAGGELSFYASHIRQDGTLRAPMGTINLGWDGTGDRPNDLIAGPNANFPITRRLVLGRHGVTSVSAVDPLTDEGTLIPYGVSIDGNSWIAPTGEDVTSTGLPTKNVSLSAAKITTARKSQIDLRGGGDLTAYRWVPGNGGTEDILAAEGSFAVIPGYSANYAPYAPFNDSPLATNLLADATDPASQAAGYVNAGLRVGDQVYLGASTGLAAGAYTLLPARYALLPGAVLVAPKSGAAMGTLALADGSSLVAGYRFNGLANPTAPAQFTRFEVAPADVFRARANYVDLSANEFLRAAAVEQNATIPVPPRDAGHLVFQATEALQLRGAVRGQSIADGRGAFIDISSETDILIAGAKALRTAPKDALVLEAGVLSGWDAESLLIGGIRRTTEDGTTVEVNTGRITVDNAGTPLTAPEIILAASDALTLAPRSEIAQSGRLTRIADPLLVDGNGALLRVSSDESAAITRTNVTVAGTAQFTVGAGARLSGASLTLDSSNAMSLDPRARLLGDAVSLDAGRIAVRLDSKADIDPSSALVLGGRALRDLAGSDSLSLLSYSSLDFYGAGKFRLDGALALHAGEIRGFQTGEGAADISADSLLLDNAGLATQPGATQAASGSLRFRAQTLTLGRGRIDIDQYASVELDASRGIRLEKNGHLIVQNDLTTRTPRISAEALATHGIRAGGDLRVLSAGRASELVDAGLGASLALQGGTGVAVASDIYLPSGALTLRAITGDVTIAGRLDVGGTAQTFNDLVKTTDAGDITLTADAGRIVLKKSGTLAVAADARGGNAGRLVIDSLGGAAVLDGSLKGDAGKDGTGGSFALDTLSLASPVAINAELNDGGFTESRDFRVRTGDVVLGGNAVARNFALSADAGSIRVTGTVDASGATGGTIALSAAGDLVLAPGAELTAAGRDFSHAGKGGAITLEAGAEINGAFDAAATLDLQAGSKIDLSVASANDQSAVLGRFTGTLHLRAPQNAAGDDLQVAAIGATIRDASSIVVEGYRIYDLSDSGGTIDATVRNQVKADGITFAGDAGQPATASYTAMLDRVLGGNAGLATVLTIRPGAELINSSGDLTLGTGETSRVSNDWNLDAFRFGPRSVPGVLTLRAAGDLIFYNALQDGFAITIPNEAYRADLLPFNPLLPGNAQSWSYRLVAGADFAAADFHRVQPLSSLGPDSGSLRLGKDNGANAVSGGKNATTFRAITGGGSGSNNTKNRYQVIRTGSGDIDIAVGRDVRLLNQFAAIYTAGTAVADATLGGTFDVPNLDLSGGNGSNALGVSQQDPASHAQYTFGGGNVRIAARNDIGHYTIRDGELVADSELQMPNNWLYRRGQIDPLTGEFGTGARKIDPLAPLDTQSTTWWVDFSNFFEGVGALGGGDVRFVAGHDVANVDAVAPTNARMPKGRPDAAALVELGGGDVTVQAGRNIDGGVYYVERGQGTLRAGAQILTNATRAFPSDGTTLSTRPDLAWLPTTLFLGKGGFDVSARGNVLLGPVANPFLLPASINNGALYKTYFSTYASTSGVDVLSLGGDVTLRQASTRAGDNSGGNVTPLLQAWLQEQFVLSSATSSVKGASYAQPWLRIGETSVNAFGTVSALLPPTVRATAFAGDIDVVGGLVLSPAARGTLDLAAGGSINGLQPNGVGSLDGVETTFWGASVINVSDASPAVIPGITSPFAYQNIVGTASFAAKTSLNDFLSATDAAFRETGATDSVLEVRQALHAPGPLHAGDKSPVRLYARTGDISGLTLFAPKAARVIAGQDVSDVGLYVQNVAAEDISIVAAGRNLLAYNASTPSRVTAAAPGNLVNFTDQAPLSGDIQVSGPGTLEVLAGRNLDLGTGASNADGTATGITTIGNARNPFLGADGARIVAGAGIGPAAGLADSTLDFDAFVADFLTGPGAVGYLHEIDPKLTPTTFAALPVEERDRVALEAFYLVLRDAGRAHVAANNAGVSDYATGFAAIAALFPTIDDNGAPITGNILTRSRDIRTKSGGDIALFVPRGELRLANSTVGNPLVPPGIVTESGGNVSIFTRGDVDIGIGRIFTLKGGDMVIWSSEGNIAAGAAAKTVKSAPPTRVLIDPQSADVQTDLAGLSTGGGIGVLATVAGVAPGDVDLIAPTGVVDAGDAGIRVSGNLHIAATRVLNASNITVAGTTSGVPSAPVVAAPNIAGLTSASNAAGAANSAASSVANQARQQTAPDETPSDITVEVLGYGGGDDSASL